MQAITHLVCPPKRQIIQCPHCKHAGHDGHYFGHLLGPAAIVGRQSFGPWYCDKCGYGINGSVNADGTVDIDLATQRKINTLVLLKYAGEGKEKFYIVVEGMMFVNANASPQEISDELIELQGRNDYFYEEHTCPWNFLRLSTSYNGDTDFHGIFSHVQTVLMPESEEDSRSMTREVEDFKRLFSLYEE